MNILLITADDMGLQAGCYGDKFAINPHLDRLASNGVRFHNAYVTQASCSPSRASLLTGLFPHRNGQVGLAGQRPDYKVHDDIPTLPAMLKDHGYFTGILGKLHVSPAEAFPFDFMWKEALHQPILTRDVRKMAELAGEFLKKSEGRPFFLYANYFDPHRPFDDGANQYKGLPEKPYKPGDVPPLDFLGEAASPNDVAAYYNCVNRLDTGIGLLMDQLDAAGVTKNTLVIFISDNGPDFTRAKTTNYEGGVRVPLMVEWPGVSQAGLVSDALVSGVDIMSTVLDAAGIESPDVSGDSLRNVLSGSEPADWRKRVSTEFTAHGASHFFPRRALRQGHYKLIRNYNSPKPNPVEKRGVNRLNQVSDQQWLAAFATDAAPPEWELYDIEKDPFELNNLAPNPEYSKELEMMRQALDAEQAENEDPLRTEEGLRTIRQAHGAPP